MIKKTIIQSVVKGFLAMAILFLIYFVILSLVSGWAFTKEQFSDFWPFIVSLAVGFGIQVGLFVYLKNMVHSQNISKGVMITTGSTSTAAMISCCAHYLVNLLPVLGVTGLVTIIVQYQIQLFWIGIFFNLLGILYISQKLYKFLKSQP